MFQQNKNLKFNNIEISNLGELFYQIISIYYMHRVLSVIHFSNSLPMNNFLPIYF